MKSTWITPADLWKYNPVRRPDERWDRAAGLIVRDEIPGPDDDCWTCRAYGYLLSLGKNARLSEELDTEEWIELIQQAREIHDDNEPLRWELEARSLAGQSIQQITDHTGLDTAVIESYQLLFWDVADRLSAGDWLKVYAIFPADQAIASYHPEAVTWRTYAVQQPAIMEALISDWFGRPAPAWPDRDDIVALARITVRLQYTPMANKREFRKILSEARQLTWKDPQAIASLNNLEAVFRLRYPSKRRKRPKQGNKVTATVADVMGCLSKSVPNVKMGRGFANL